MSFFLLSRVALSLSVTCPHKKIKTESNSSGNETWKEQVHSSDDERLIMHAAENLNGHSVLQKAFLASECLLLELLSFASIVVFFMLI